VTQVFYEEDGGFKVGAVLADNDTSLQVEAAHGKRSKIKSAAVMLRFEQPSLTEFMQSVDKETRSLDVDFLWECCGENEFAFADLGRDYYGHAPTPIESAAVLTRLHGAPMYFYKRGKGRYKAAPEEALKAALAGAERKRQQDALKAQYVQALQKGEMPEAFKPILQDLLYKPDKNSLEYKALDAAATAAKQTPLQVLAHAGGIPSTHEYHLHGFLFEYFPEGTDLPALTLTPPANELPLASVSAFSIDDAATTEIDDAFSVTTLPGNTIQVGIHIAAPALGIALDDPVDRIARQRLSTIYIPGRKITMLPDAAIEQFTLSAGRTAPTLSLYLTFAGNDYTLIESKTRLESVSIKHNLRHDQLDEHFTEANINGGLGDYPYKPELLTLWRIANKLEAARGKAEAGPPPLDYNFYIDNDCVRIVPRPRGSPIDKVVSELMIKANAEWGQRLAEANIAAIYRTQGNGKVSMSVEPAGHQGLGVSHYAWSSSPLRRYVDLVNQRQLIAWVNGTPPPYTRTGEELGAAIRDFDIAYEAYAEIQRKLERYWCLRYLQQEHIEIAKASVLRESLVRVSGLPLVCRVPSLPNLPFGTEVEVEIGGIDLWALELTCRFKAKLG
jgi:exoribonuclease II